MNELFVDEIVDLINDFEVDTKSHFGKVLNRLRDDQTTLRSTATTCLCLLASSIYKDIQAAGICRKIGESFGYFTGMFPHTPPAIGVAGIAQMGIQFLDWCHAAGLITVSKIRMEDAKNVSWRVLSTQKFEAEVLSNHEKFSKLPLTEGPIEWEKPVILRDGILVELVKQSKRHKLLSLYTKDKMPKVYESVNRMNAQTWVVDEFVFDIMNKAELGNPFMPDNIYEDELEAAKKGLSKVSFKTNSYKRFLLKEVLTDGNITATDAMRIAKRNADARFVDEKNIHKDILSKWDKQIDFSKALLQATDLRGKTINFVYDFDSRGRAYVANSSFLQPLGSDISKALLSYADYKPVDLYHLAISTANSWGHDKLNYEERVEWCNENMDMLRAVGEDPWAHLDYLISIGLHNEKKDKWQALRLARVWFELHEHIDAGNSQDTFMSNTPIARDGTNQGLQILSLLSLCEWTAAQTNLKNNFNEDGKQVLGDIYQFIGDFVPQELDKVPEDKKTETLMAFKKHLEDNPKARRKVAKRNTMCKSYNLTRYGAGDAHVQDKGDYGFVEAEKLTYGDCFILGGVIYDLLKSKLPAASEMMQFMVDAVDLLPDDASPIVTWKLPDGFTGFTYKGKTKSVDAKGWIGKNKVILSLQISTNEINKRGHRLAIAPNIVHSFDATILRKIVLAMPQDASISTVHDSFSTDSIYVDEMVIAAREAYKAVCNRSYFKQMMEDAFNTTITLPEPGELSVDDLDDCDYFIS